jgi:hypothetical protein
MSASCTSPPRSPRPPPPCSSSAPQEPTAQCYAARDAQHRWNAALLAALFSSLSFAQKLFLQMRIGNVAGVSLKSTIHLSDQVTSSIVMFSSFKDYHKFAEMHKVPIWKVIILMGFFCPLDRGTTRSTLPIFVWPHYNFVIFSTRYCPKHHLKTKVPCLEIHDVPRQNQFDVPRIKPHLF